MDKSIRIFFNQSSFKYEVVLLCGRISDKLGEFDSELQASRYVSSISGNGRNISVYMTDTMILDVKHFVEGYSFSDKIRNCINYYLENH